jgi:very-short-patch-repair endonuclease
MRKEGDNPGPDAVIARIATNQHGVVSAEQIRSAHLSPAGVTRRLAAGRLHRIHRRVYAVGHPKLSETGRWMAAVLACGEGAVLSHLSAAALWGIRRSSAATVHVTVPSTSGKRRRDGILLHRSSTLTASSSTRHDGIHVTNPSRTLADIRPLLSPAQFNAVVREARFRRLPVGDPFGEAGGSATARTRTELEHRMLALCRRHHRLPQPDVNVKIDRYEVDFLWRDARLIVEVDGWDTHRTRSAFEEDRARDARLKVLGYDVLRFTWRQVADRPKTVARTVRLRLHR